MRPFFTAIVATALLVGAAPAFAEEASAQVDAALAAQTAPSARELQSTVDAYVASSNPDATLVAGAGSAGYDGGFWVRGGTFLMKINLTLQTRFEYVDWDMKANEANDGGDLSGFSLPRVTLKFSGDATCHVHYFTELEFGHAGSIYDNSTSKGSVPSLLDDSQLLFGQRLVSASADAGLAREAWIEYEAAPQLAFRMGLVKTAATRQLMTPPEMQQFVDISLASACIGTMLPGYSDRNRDYGFMVHGALGCDGEVSYLATVTNGDGDGHRNVLDGATDDPLAYSARVNWDVQGHMGYEEGALRQRSCRWAGALGAWTHYYVDHGRENSITHRADRFAWGFDAAAAWRGLSLTAAYSNFTWDQSDTGDDRTGRSWLAQVGFLVPHTAWEVAARYDAYTFDPPGTAKFTGTEFAFAVNYYITGHADKVTADFAFISADNGGNLMADAYAGYSATYTSDGMLLRLQWQLAL